MATDTANSEDGGPRGGQQQITPRPKDQRRPRHGSATATPPRRNETRSGIEGIEARRSAIEAELIEASAQGDGARIAALGIEHKTIEAELAVHYNEGDHLSSES